MSKRSEKLIKALLLCDSDGIGRSVAVHIGKVVHLHEHDQVTAPPFRTCGWLHVTEDANGFEFSVNGCSQFRLCDVASVTVNGRNEVVLAVNR